MENDKLMNTDEMFNKYYRDGLVIRAICDDKDFPGEYSPIFVSIHIRGVDYYKNLGGEVDYDKIFNLMDPSLWKEVQEKLDEVEPSDVKDLVSKLCIGEQLDNMDKFLSETQGMDNFFLNQIKNQKRLHEDPEFRAHMVSLYSLFVKPNMASYTDEKIEAAFIRGRINDSIRRNKEQEDPKEDIA